MNYQHNYSDDTNFIEVEAATLTELLEDLNISANEIPLIKLDIEGAEIEVISDFLDKDFLPEQNLVEFDGLNVPSERAFRRVDEIHTKLERFDYECVRTDGQADFLYVRVQSLCQSGTKIGKGLRLVSEIGLMI